jgi:PAT family beta-lactamase induction signal transducer AmpG
MSDSLDSRPATVRRGWLAAAAIYLQPRSLRFFFLGFSAGLPLLLVLGTLSFWLRDAGIDRSTIGFLSWVGLAYGFKWAWAPLVDRLPLPLLTRWLGRRRGWLIAAQLVLMASLAAMAFTDPREQLGLLAVLALVTAFASATQDIALDAYRIESAPVDEQAALAATYQTGYRLAMIWAGAGVLTIAAHFDPSEASYEQAPWTAAYLMMAASMAVGLVATLLAPEPQAATAEQTAARAAEFATRANALAERRGWSTRAARLALWLHEAALSPFLDFFRRYGWHAALVLALIATYRISDIVMGVMANPFYKDMGFSKEEVAAVSKLYGVVMTLVGAFVGGVVALRVGVMKTLFAGALLSSVTNLLFVALAERGHDLGLLILAVSADNLASGIASAAFIAYLSGLTNVAYSATQYALFSSVMLLLPKFLAGLSGVAVDTWGYAAFFTGTAALGLPVLLLVVLAARVSRSPAPRT